MVLRMKNFDILGVHWKIQLLVGGGGGVHKKPIYRGDCWKGGGGLGQFDNLRGAWQEKWGWYFWGGGEGWYPNVHYESVPNAYFSYVVPKKAKQTWCTPSLDHLYWLKNHAQ